MTSSTESVKHLVINADDLGICESTNLAIEQAFREGVLTSTSLLANGPAFDHAVRRVVRPNPGLGVGLHLNLTSGRSILPRSEVPGLVDANGRLRLGFLLLYLRTQTAGGGFLEQVEAELESQFRRVHDAGVEIDHVDGHRYTHMIPPIYKIATDLAARFACRFICVPDERLRPISGWLRPTILATRIRNLSKCLLLGRLTRKNRRDTHGLCTPDSFFGVLESGRMDRQALSRIIRFLPEGLTHVVTHPGWAAREIDADCASEDQCFLRSSARQREFEALVHPAIRQQTETAGIHLVRFRDIVPLVQDGGTPQ